MKKFLQFLVLASIASLPLFAVEAPPVAGSQNVGEVAYGYNGYYGRNDWRARYWQRGYRGGYYYPAYYSYFPSYDAGYLGNSVYYPVGANYYSSYPYYHYQPGITVIQFSTP